MYEDRGYHHKVTRHHAGNNMKHGGWVYVYRIKTASQTSYTSYW